jgi:hypothetical protein
MRSAIEQFHATSLHRILQASDAGDINAYILCPAVVHGPGLGPVGRASIFFKFYLQTIFKVNGLFIAGDGNYRIETVPSLHFAIAELINQVV